MFVQVEPSGCCEHKGMVQIRFCFYLDAGDYDYGKTIVNKEVVPFHNHFIYVSPSLSNKAILDIGEGFLKEAYEHWSNDKIPMLINTPVTLSNRTSARITSCQNKVNTLKTVTLSSKVV